MRLPLDDRDDLEDPENPPDGRLPERRDDDRAPISTPVRIAVVFEELRRVGRRYVACGTRGGVSIGDAPEGPERGGAVGFGFGFSGFGGAGLPSSSASTLSSCQIAWSSCSAVVMSCEGDCAFS